MALSWATVQVLAAVPWVPGRETKNPPVLPSLRSLSFLLFPLFSLFGPQTELKEQLHTPDASTSDKAQSAVGQQAGAHVTEKFYTTMVFASFPPFSEPSPPPHTLCSAHLSHALFFALFFHICQSLGLFALLLLKSTVLSGAHTKGWNLFHTVLHTLVIELSLIFSWLLSELISKILCRIFKEIILWH